MIEPIHRYDLLCIEGIARALRVFLGKDNPTVYKLHIPPGGERDLIEVKIAPEVCTFCYHRQLQMFTLRTDQPNSSIVRMRCPARRHLHSPIIPVFHRVARKASSKLMPASATCGHRNARSRHHPSSFPIRSSKPKGYKIRTTEQGQGLYCR